VPLRTWLAAVCIISACAPLGCTSCDGTFTLACTVDGDCPVGARCGAGACVAAAPAVDAGVVVVVDGGTADAGDAGDAGPSPVDAGPTLGVDAGPAHDHDDAGQAVVDAGQAIVDAGPPCIDRDGDGRGDNCALGPDCDDGDARVYAGHPEECDGIDNDCNGVVDDGDRCGCFPIRIGDGKDPRQLCTTPRNYDDAQAECRRRGYQLAIFQSAGEAQQLFDASDGLETWFGLQRIPGRRGQVAGDFVWNDGTAITFDLFGSGEPSDNENLEDCADFRGGGWNDENCAQFLAFLCEPAPPAPVSAVDSAADCHDQDGDGRGDGCALGRDCDDSDADAFALIGGVQDSDGDGVMSRVRALRCASTAVPAGLVADPPDGGVDCDDTDPAHSTGCPNSLACTTAAADAGPLSICTGDDRSFDDADGKCGDRFAGAHLVAVVDQATDDEVAQLTLGGHVNLTWIGVTDEHSAPTFELVDGTPIGAFHPFRHGEPSNSGGNEQCIEIESGGWNDDQCSTAISYVCQ
jgi:hypothetical protein